jgi:hypothetical protein
MVFIGVLRFCYAMHEHNSDRKKRNEVLEVADYSNRLYDHSGLRVGFIRLPVPFLTLQYARDYRLRFIFWCHRLFRLSPIRKAKFDRMFFL